MKNVVLPEPVLIGRERELEELQNYMDSAFAGNGLTVFLSGEAGVGKTRITTEFLNRARKSGATVLTGSCLGNVTVPYFPFIEAFDAYFAAETEDEQNTSFSQPETQPNLGGTAFLGSQGAGIMAWLSGPNPAKILGKPEATSPQVWHDQTFTAVARILHSVSVRQPLIIFFDDIHWADSASLGLIHYISKIIGSEKILLLATFRSEELTVDEEGHPHPLVEALQLMRRENLVKEVKLQGLDKQSVSKLAESMVKGTIDPTLVGKLTQESQGNPLFVVESLRMLHERKSLFQENNQWRLSVDELGIPSKIREIILRRIGTLKLSQRRILDAASVIGDKFDVELLGAVLKEDTLEVLEILNFVAMSTSLVCCEQDFFRFDHAKSRETFYEEIPLPLKKGYHARIAEKLEASAKNGKLPVSELAYHYTQAGNQEKALTYSLAAGKDALARFSNNEAITLFKYVLEVVQEAPKHLNEKLAALEGLGDAYFANSMFKEATKTFELLASLATGATSLGAFNKAIGSTLVRGDIQHAWELVMKAEENPIDDRLKQSITSFQKGSMLGVRGKQMEGIEICAKAVRVFEEEYSIWNLAIFLGLFGSSLIFIDRVEEGVVALLRSIAYSGDLGDNHLQASAYQTAGQLIYMNCGTTEEPSEMLSKSVAIAEKIADYNKIAEAYCVWSWIISNKDPQGGIDKALKAKEYAEKTDSERVQAMVYSTLARDYVLMEDMENAKKYYDKLMTLPKEMLYIPGPQSLKTIAMYNAAKGQWEKSFEFFTKQFEMNKRLSPGAEAMTKIHYAWALEKQGRNEEAKKLREQAQTEWERLDKRFEHVNLRTSVMAPANVVTGKEFEARLEIANPSRGKGSLTQIETLLTPDFKVLSLTPECATHGFILEMKENTIKPFTIKTIKMTLKATKNGTYNLSPQVIYIDDAGQTKTSISPTIIINAKPAQPTFETLPNRVTTGTEELDNLLLGGIPANYAVVLASPSTDERQLLIKNFLEAGVKAGQITFHITLEPNNVIELAKMCPSNFFLIICNPQADTIVQNASNIFKLKGIENLTEIDITLTKAFRKLEPIMTSPRRACIEITSDVLLQHHTIIARKWLSGLLPTLKSKGFTTIAVIDPQMHAQEEVQAIIGLFEGEIRITEKETAQGSEKTLKIRKLYHQKYSENEIPLTKEKLT